MYTIHSQNKLKTKILNFIILVWYKNGNDVCKTKGNKAINIFGGLKWYKLKEQTKIIGFIILVQYTNLFHIIVIWMNVVQY